MKHGRKISGGRYHAIRKLKLFERFGKARLVILGETKRKNMKVRGGNIKNVLLKSNEANVSVNGKIKKAEIKNVVETPQNKFFARENRLSKGAIIDTSLGRARISNRPTQEGHINAVLLESK